MQIVVCDGSINMLMQVMSVRNKLGTLASCHASNERKIAHAVRANMLMRRPRLSMEYHDGTR